MPQMTRFNPKITHVLVTDQDTGPEGWELMPMQDLNVFYNPCKFDEVDIIKLIDDFENDGELFYNVAHFDTALDRELCES
jgi:hypothetical protein